MKHLFSPKYFKTIIALLVLLLIIKIVWFAVEMTQLPATGVDHVKEAGVKSLYYRVKLTPNEAPAPVKKDLPKVQSSAGSISDITLYAIYNASTVTVVTIEYKGKTKVLSKGDKVNGFVLEGAGSNFATFSKASKTYKVNLRKGKKSPQGTTSSEKRASQEEMPPSKKAEGDISDAGDHKIVDRSLIDHYATNMDDIYKNIGITESKKNGAMEFKISFVRKNSPFAKLGVKRGDIIKSINGQEINSYNAAFGMYKNIKNIENLTLVIQRGKEEMELEYEIN
jgi:general secretion pathway protein C